MPEMRKVFSSHVESIGYEDGELFVTYKSGKTAVYEKVPENVAEMVTGAASIGSALNAYIKDVYGFRYLDE